MLAPEKKKQTIVLPASGAVLGVDIGWSEQRASSAACLLVWDARHVGWEIRRFSARADHRARVLSGLLAGRKVLLVALDGPLHPQLLPLSQHREAERALTLGIGKLVGQPGSVVSPTGQKLHAMTQAVARDLLARRVVQRPKRINTFCPLGLVEAFPSAFMGVMLPQAFATPRAQRSNLYFSALSGTDPFGLLALLCRLLPERCVLGDVVRIKNRDDRAAFVAALSALSVVAGQFSAVGDRFGHIILPPLAESAHMPGMQSWAQRQLWTALRFPEQNA